MKWTVIIHFSLTRSSRIDGIINCLRAPISSRILESYDESDAGTDCAYFTTNGDLLPNVGMESSIRIHAPQADFLGHYKAAMQSISTNESPGTPP